MRCHLKYVDPAAGHLQDGQHVPASRSTVSTRSPRPVRSWSVPEELPPGQRRCLGASSTPARWRMAQTVLARSSRGGPAHRGCDGSLGRVLPGQPQYPGRGSPAPRLDGRAGVSNSSGAGPDRDARCSSVSGRTNNLFQLGRVSSRASPASTVRSAQANQVGPPPTEAPQPHAAALGAPSRWSPSAEPAVPASQAATRGSDRAVYVPSIDHRRQCLHWRNRSSEPTSGRPSSVHTPEPGSERGVTRGAREIAKTECPSQAG
jgi:hypothetical protein